jgi:hypothetical protein
MRFVSNNRVGSCAPFLFRHSSESWNLAALLEGDEREMGFQPSLE